MQNGCVLRERVNSMVGPDLDRHKLDSWGMFELKDTAEPVGTISNANQETPSSSLSLILVPNGS